MNRFSRRLQQVVRGGVLLAAMIGAVACGGGNGGDGEAGKPVTVTFWQFWPTETLNPLIQAFEAENPGIRVEMQQLTWQSGLEKITAAVAAGQPPDLCELGSTWFAKFAANGALADLTTQATNLRPGYLMWDACTYQGKVYGFPWVTGTRVLFYNRTLVEQAGSDPDVPPQTWSELRDLVRRMHRPGDRVYGYGLNSGERYVQFKKFMPYAWGNGGQVLTSDHTGCAVASPQMAEALNFYISLKDYSLLEKQEVLDQAFKDGQLGAMISGAWLLKTIPRDAPDLEFGVALVPKPAHDRGQHASFGGGEILVTFSRSRQQEAALKLARYLMAAPQAMAVARAEQSVLPAAVEASADPYFTENPLQAVFLKQLETAVFPPNIEGWVEIQDAVDTWLERAVFGKKGTPEALSGACRDIEAILARTGS